MKSRDAMNTRFYVENPHTNCGDKKTTRSKTININPLYEIKLHRFT